MSFFSKIPEISVQEVAQKRQNGDSFVLLDVRELLELERVSLGPDVVVAPLSQLAREGTDALPDEAQDKEAEIVVICHHGNRSAQVTAWLSQQGWNNVWNMAGGVDAYALEVDPSIGRY